MSKLSFIFLLTILLLGAYLRLHHISGYMTYLGDEGRDVLVVARMIVDHKFTLLGPTASVGGFFLGPIYYYFMLPFLWLWNFDPTGPAVMVGLFGIATIFLVYLLGKKMFDEWVGLIAAALYAVSPLVIAYSRSSWNPNLVPFFSGLLLLLLYDLATQAKWNRVFWVGVVLGIGIQLHYLFLFLFIVALLWVLALGKWKGHLPYYFLCVSGFLVGYAPFLLFELRHGFPNTFSIINFLREGEETGFDVSSFFHTVGDVTFRLFGRLILRIPETHMYASFPKEQISLWIGGTKALVYISIGLMAFYLAGISREIREGFDKLKTQGLSFLPDGAKAILLLSFWLAIILFLFGLYRKGIYDYYFGIVFIIPFLLTAWVLRHISKFRYGGVIAALVCVGLLYLNWQGRPFLYPPNNQLAQARRIAWAAYEQTDGRSFNFALITGNNSDHAYRYFFEVWGEGPVTIENTNLDPERKSVTDQLIVICEIECKPLGHPLWEVAGFGRAEIVGEWDVPFVKIFKLVHYEE